MKLGLILGYSGSGMHMDMDMVTEAEKLGYDSVWTAEAWGSDAVTPLAWLAAKTEKIKLGAGIMQLPGRSPANTAMTAMTLDHLSKGRFILGLGTSGPQVVEGWHGMPFDKPLTWMREYLTIVETIIRREEALTFEGKKYQIPYMGEGSTGLGKPLKSILHPLRKKIPTYTGSMAPKGQALCGELADGVLLTCMNPERPEVITDNLQEGIDRVEGKTLADVEIVPTVAVVVNDDLDACRGPLKFQLALYIGGMGAKDKNFYKEYVEKVGFEAEANKIQNLYLEGRKGEAIAAVSDEMIDAFYLVGSKDRIRDTYQKWKESPVTTMLIGSVQPEAIRLMAELAL